MRCGLNTGPWLHDRWAVEGVGTPSSEKRLWASIGPALRDDRGYAPWSFGNSDRLPSIYLLQVNLTGKITACRWISNGTASLT